MSVAREREKGVGVGGEMKTIISNKHSNKQ